MACSTSIQIYKVYGGLEVFILRVQTELYNSVFRLRKFPGFSLTFSLFQIQYPLHSGELICAYHSDHSAIFVDHYGSLLIQGGGLVDLQ
jgi:hypothetical protein